MKTEILKKIKLYKLGKIFAVFEYMMDLKFFFGAKALGDSISYIHKNFMKKTH